MSAAAVVCQIFVSASFVDNHFARKIVTKSYIESSFGPVARYQTREQSEWKTGEPKV